MRCRPATTVMGMAAGFANAAAIAEQLDGDAAGELATHWQPHRTQFKAKQAAVRAAREATLSA